MNTMKTLVIMLLFIFIVTVAVAFKMNDNRKSFQEQFPRVEYKSKDSLLEGNLLIIRRDKNNNIYVKPASYDDARYYLEANGEG